METTDESDLPNGQDTKHDPDTKHDRVQPDNVKDAMLDRIARTDAHFKHQQRDEPDLTTEQKRAIASELLRNSPGTFLGRFNKYLLPEDLVYFTDMRNTDYTVDFYVKEIQKRASDVKNCRVRNRRYEAMKKLIAGGEYFSDREMKAREPLLYEQMVGQYLTEEEVMAEARKSDGAISTVLLDQIDAIYNNELYARQVEKEESQFEEGDSDEEEMMEDDEKEGAEGTQISEAEKQMLRNEFLSIMKQRFLHGDDTEFNYKDVDECSEYDSLDIRSLDEEEKYFDTDD